MKKIYILAAIALVAGVSCTKQVPADNNSPDVPIGFSPISQRAATKANVFGEQNATYTAGTSPNYESFLAYAAYTADAATLPSTNFFPAEGVECVYNVATAPADYWAPATPYYWPKAGFLTFRAFSPSTWTGATGYAGTVSNTWNTGITISSFTAGTDKAEQLDILYSDVEPFKQRSNYTPENGIPYDDKAGDDNSVWNHSGVNITFRHAMSAVQFRVVTNQDYAPTSGTYKHEFTVKKIEVLHANTTGAFYENRDGSTVDKLNTFANVPGGVTKYVTKNKDNAATATPYWVPTESTENDYTVYENATGQSVHDLATADAATNKEFGLYGDLILPMPQYLSHGDGSGSAGNQQVQVKITYDYKFTLGSNVSTFYNLTTTVSLGAKNAGKYNGSAETYTVNNWLINHKYLYTLVFKLDPIIFDPKVEAFVEVSDINVDLPYKN